jgi:hypothetical protein
MAAAKKDPFEAGDVASDEVDPFEEASAAPVKKFPSIKQLGSGAPKVKATYAKGKDQEQTRDTTGRMLLIKPRKVDRNQPSNFEGNDPTDRWSCDVVVLDGETITEAVDKDGDVTYVFPEPLVPPFLLENMYISQTMLGQQIDDKWDAANGRARTMLLGRLMQLPANKGRSKPWVIGDFTPADAATAKKWVKEHPEPDAFED